MLGQAGPCCNNPIFAEIVPTHMRTMVYAFDRLACHLCFPLHKRACTWVQHRVKPLDAYAQVF